MFTTTPHIHRHRTPRGESITLVGRDYSVTIEVTTRGLELDAATLERVLHAPLALLAARQCETI